MGSVLGRLVLVCGLMYSFCGFGLFVYWAWFGGFGVVCYRGCLTFVCLRFAWGGLVVWWLGWFCVFRVGGLG